MAIKKDNDDKLSNLKNKNKSESVKPVNKGTAPKKLAPLPQKKAVPEKKPVSAENKPKKRIVISSELPDYDAIRAEELEKDKLKKARAEAERKAREEAERKAREEAERKAREEAERKAREEAERKTREEAERKAREEAERKAREEAERKAREEAERKAREEAERKAREEAERKAREEEKKRLKAEKKAKEEEEKKRRKEERRRKRLEEEQKRLEAEKTADEDDENFSIEEVTDDDISEETESDPVGSLIDNIREDAEKAVADIENGDSYTDDNDETEEAVTDDERDIEATSFRISPVLEKILDEDPDEIINERSEKTVSDDESESGSKFKKNFYAVFGVIFAVFACVGFIAVVSKGISMISGYTSGDNKKNGFESIVYPVVIMDIDSFDNPTELPSDQIITASIWSMIMSENAISNYEMTFDVVKIPAVDVESYAVKLFGENLPSLNHTTVGPAESRFYYNEETKSYNVPIAPVTYTYSPEIKGATKNGDTYTIVVNYIDELPEWLPKVSSKSVEFKLTETNDGYTINSMKVLSTTNNSL